jgi:hypothetical protein
VVIVDVEPINKVPTWRNNELGGEGFSTILDGFLTYENLLMEVGKI